MVMDSVEQPISEALRSHLLLENFKGHSPEGMPYVTLACASSQETETDDFEGRLKEFCGIQAYLVPLPQRHLVEAKYQYNSFPFAGETHFDDDGTYHPAETFEEDGVLFEIVVSDRHFVEQGMKYFEPTDRLVKYLNLHREEGQWIDPRNSDN